MTFGERLKQIRKKKKLSGERLGQLAGVTGTTICRYEKGHEQPKWSTAAALSDVLNVSLDWMCGRENYDDPPERSAADTLGEKLKEAREMSDLFIYELAALAGVDRGSARDIENGTLDPHLGTVIKLAETLYISLDWLAERKE